ncbi:MAG: hypothetical protein ACWGN7_06900 [Thermodesulfovibrionales bacterium]
MINKNVAAQTLTLILAVIGAYLTAITLITIYGAVIGKSFIIVVVASPMLVVGIFLLLFSYRAFFKPSEKNNRNFASIYAAIILLYSGRIVEAVIPKSDVIVNQRVVASGSTIVLAALVYYGIQILLRGHGQDNPET